MKAQANKWFQVIIGKHQTGYAKVDARGRYCFYFSRYEATLYMSREEAKTYTQKNKIVSSRTGKSGGVFYVNEETQLQVEYNYGTWVNR